MSSSDSIKTVSRSLPSCLDAYQNLIEQILNDLTELGWQKNDLFGVRMALEESISNAVRHGNKEDPTKQVHVECQLSPSRFWARICDEGEGYESAAVPDCCSPENLESPGGRGLALIRAYMSSVEHVDKGNCLTMEKKVSQ